MMDAQTLFVALHGIATLVPALPGFPWVDRTDLIRTMIVKIVGPPQTGATAVPTG